ncbi:MAG: cytochrome c maturation protein CcmE [Betaproteobacteria bacterium]|jgi:cytochrome c-type biogenesis protein CcmE|nr:cytochrome c maturation protein CcmE [Betaproteobacteria bacterium]
MLNKSRQIRLLWILGLVIAVSATVYSVLRVFNDNLVLFYTPTQLKESPPPGRNYRLGGMVEMGSLVRTGDGLSMRFRVTDQNNVLSVTYTGITPDLFKEGKGVVAQGRLEDGIFVATEILAKHDENYMPPKLKQ